MSPNQTTVNVSFESINVLSKTTYIVKHLCTCFHLCDGWCFSGAFLIPFVVMITLCGFPLYFLEYSLAKFSGKGPYKIWDICPLFRGKFKVRVFLINIRMQLVFRPDFKIKKKYCHVLLLLECFRYSLGFHGLALDWYSLVEKMSACNCCTCVRTQKSQIYICAYSYL